MKVKLYFIVMTLVLLIAGCTRDPEVDDPDDPTPPTIPEIDDYSVVLTTQEMRQAIVSTKVSYSENGLQLSWANDDVVRIYDGDGDYHDMAYTEPEDGTDESYFKFSSDDVKPDGEDSYVLIFPASLCENSESLEELSIDLTEQTQVGNNNLDHLTDYTTMSAYTNTLNEVIFMKHHTAQLKFLITLPSGKKGSDVKSIRISTTKSGQAVSSFITKQSVDCTTEDQDATSLETASSLTFGVTLDDNDVSGGDELTIYAMIFPTEFDGYDVEVELLGSDDTVLTSRNESGITRSFPAGYQHYAMLEDSIDLYSESAISDTNVQWTQFGPGMSGNNKIAYWHPTDPKCLFISPNMGNSYVSYDGGLTYKTLLNYDAHSYKFSPGVKISGVTGTTSNARGIEGFTSVDFSYTDADFGFATDTGSSGLFATADRGTSWVIQDSSFDTFYGVYLACVEVDPTNDNTWYLGAGTMRDIGNMLFPSTTPHGTTADSNSQCKVWRSDDRGATWTLKNSGLHEKAEVETIYVDPVYPNIVYMSSNYGFYRSTDKGESWTHVGVRPDWESSSYVDEREVIRSMAMHRDEQTDAVTLFVISNVTWKPNGSTLTNDGGGVFKSTDRGLTWTAINGTGNGTLSINLSEISSSSALSGYQTAAAYFMTAATTTTSFKTSYPDTPTDIMQRFHWIEVDPNDVNNIFVCNDYANASLNNFLPGMLWRTTDGGSTWFITTRNGKVWDNDTSGYGTSSTNYKTITSGYTYWGTRANQPRDNNITFRYLKEWYKRSLYDSKAMTTAKFNSDGTILHSQMAKISLMSYDNGDTWVDIDDTYTIYSDDDSFIGAGNSNLPGHGFYQHPDIPNKIYCCAGENSLWIADTNSTDIYDGLSATNVRFFSGTEMSLSSYVIHPTDLDEHHALFFRQTYQGEILRSTTGGESDTWTSLGRAVEEWDTASYSGDQSVHQLCLSYDPSDLTYKTMFFCVPWLATNLEYVGDSMANFGIHRSKDGGTTWECVNNNLPASNNKGSAYATDDGVEKPSIPRLAYHDGKIFVAVELKYGGLFYSEDKGNTWSEVESTKNLTIYNGADANAGMNDIHFNVDGSKAYITVGAINASSHITNSSSCDYNCGVWVCDIDSDGEWMTDSSKWKKIFSHPFPARIETARYDKDLLLITVLGNYGTAYINPGTYVSYNGGAVWNKINFGNGQSDRVNDIAIDYTREGRYYASTYGSGWYYVDDPNY